MRLAPIRDFEKIKVSNLHSTFEPKIFQQFPTIQAEFFTHKPFHELTDTLAMNVEFYSDFVVLLSHMAPASFDLDESEAVCGALENMIHRRYWSRKKFVLSLLKENEEKLSLRSETELRKMIRELPIFKSFPLENVLVSLGARNAQGLIYKQAYKQALPGNLIKKYLEANNILLIEYIKYEKLQDFLEIKNKSLSQFYEEYLTWSVQTKLREEPNTKREHMKILNDQFNNDISGL